MTGNSSNRTERESTCMRCGDPMDREESALCESCEKHIQWKKLMDGVPSVSGAAESPGGRTPRTSIPTLERRCVPVSDGDEQPAGIREGVDLVDLLFRLLGFAMIAAWGVVQ